MNIIKKCPACNKKHSIDVSGDKEKDLKSFMESGEVISRLFDRFNAVERRFLEDGTCPECQAKRIAVDEEDARNINAVKSNRHEWKNFGDVNFLSEGGTMVRFAWDEDVRKQYPSLAGSYECICLTRIDDDKMLVFKKLVDIEDYREAETLNAMRSFFGEIPDDEALFAAYCAEYTGLEAGMDQAYKQTGMYAKWDDYLLGPNEAKAWLKDLGVSKEYIA